MHSYFIFSAFDSTWAKEEAGEGGGKESAPPPNIWPSKNFVNMPCNKGNEQIKCAFLTKFSRQLIINKFKSSNYFTPVIFKLPVLAHKHAEVKQQSMQHQNPSVECQTLL